MGNNSSHFVKINNYCNKEEKEISVDKSAHQQQKILPPDHQSKDLQPQESPPQNYNQSDNLHKSQQQSYPHQFYHTSTHKQYSIQKYYLNIEEKDEILEKDFDYSKIDKLLEEVDKKKENIILLTTGSFNPIHRMHLEILNIAANCLLKLKKYNVLCGFISPSADCYVKNKKPPLIPFDLRCKIIQTAIEEYNLENIKNKKNENLKIFLHTWEGSQDHFIDFPYVIKEIQSRLLIYNVKLVYVCGLDLFINCRYYFSKNVIAVDRKPFKNKYKSIPNKMIFIIKDSKTEPYSSTFIKECFMKNDYKSIEKVTFPKVAEMIIEFYKKNFN